MLLMPARKKRPRTRTDASGPSPPRLTPEQRQAMRAHFWAVKPAAFYAACWVYLSTEMNFSPRHRDYQGIADLQEIARLRGLDSQFEEAELTVESQREQETQIPPESKIQPPWETNAGYAWPGHYWFITRKQGNLRNGTSTKTRGGCEGDETE